MHSQKPERFRAVDVTVYQGSRVRLRHAPFMVLEREGFPPLRGLLRAFERPAPARPCFLDMVAGPWAPDDEAPAALHLRPLPEFDDGETVDPDNSPAARLGRERRAVMLEIAQRDTGNTMDAYKALQHLARKDELNRQTEEIGRRLVRGWRTIAEECRQEAIRCRDLGQRSLMRTAALRMADHLKRSPLRRTPFSLYTYYVHSRTVVRQEQFRRINFLPAVAQKLRASKLLAVEAFIQAHPFARMFTFTSGARVALPGLRNRVETFHRRLSKLACWLRRVHRVEMVFRSTELGKPERRTDGSPDGAAGTFERDADGSPTFHVHGHTVVWSLTGYRTPSDWAHVRRSVWAKWGFHWDDSGPVQDPRELVKYMCKPGAVLALSDRELCELYEALRGLRLVAPMGTLRAEIRERVESERTFDRQPTPDGRVLRTVPDWNRWGKARSEPETVEALRTVLETRPTDDSARSRLVQRGRPKPDDVPARIVARLAPSFAPGSLIAEPRVVVLAFRWDQAQIDANAMVVDLRESTADQWRAGRALALRVHVGTSTVPAEFPAAADWISRAPPELLGAPETALTAAQTAR